MAYGVLNCLLLCFLQDDADVAINYQPRTRELWWRGIAPMSRAEVWEKAIGNDLALTVATYARALQRSQDIEAQIREGTKYELCKEQAWFNAIRRDVNAILPELKLFQLGSPLHDNLTNVLMAYCMYRSDVGYSYGTHVSLRYSTNTCPLYNCRRHDIGRSTDSSLAPRRHPRA